MYQIDVSSAVGSLPTPAAAGTAGFFTDGNPGSGLPATIVPADFLNMVMQELINVVNQGGIPLSKTSYTQVRDAIANMIAAGGGGGGSGTVTAVTGIAPINSSGGAAPAISISAATDSAAGSMSAADKTKLDGIAAGATANTGTVTAVTVASANGVSATVANQGTTPALTIALGAITPTSISTSGASSAASYTAPGKVTAGSGQFGGGVGFGGGVNFGSLLAASTVDLSKHINMYAGAFGWCITSRGLNHVTNTSHYFVSASSGADIAQISSAGITANGYDTYSDPRLKSNLQPQAIAGDVDSIGLWTWQWNSCSKQEGEGAGVRSDEVREVFPQCVRINEDDFDVVDYGKLGVHLGVVANRRVREAEARAEAAERRANTMADALANLAARVEELEQRA